MKIRAPLPTAARLRVPGLALAGLLLGACASGSGPSPAPSPAASEGPRTVQPGAPGEATRTVEATNISEMGGVAYVDADVAFMQGMIPHHAQALQMTALARENTRDPGVRRLALRMEISQRDEIALMSRWLADRGEEVPASAAMTDEARLRASLQGIGEGGMHMDHGAHGGMAMMPGMLTPDQLARLAEARSETFDRLFLEYMIQHHEGAILMVDTLFSTDGAGEESEIFQFASHVDADQRAEIARMNQMLDARGGRIP